MTNPNAGILVEIDDQNLRGIAFGADAHPNTLSFTCEDSFTFPICVTFTEDVGICP
ncbi:hypothetical protein O4J56_12995 [Nocardiopsis sp. RSe5-2]|uniref:Lantibiotic n=1 Tax=Nocardiopsis endophytica TaxID=3018445 RepID=A0ABT4U4B3_9ACTN|nr:hypothetical protein [Nocardiopsis endophytica]MDA2811551.1 hypothetical protein [Nocardiopsis endophytica]